MTTKILEYKGYQGSVEFSLENNILYGKIQHINDLVSYDADDIRGLQSAFEDAVNDYIEMCEESGTQPDRPFSGSFNIRIGHQLHKDCTKQAYRENKSLNEWVKDAIECHLHGRHQENHHYYPQSPNTYEANVTITQESVHNRPKLRVVQ